MKKGPKTAIRKRIENLLGAYFSKINSSPQSLNYKIAKPLFLLILSDYLSGLITVEEFSLVCHELYYKVKEPGWYDSFDPELSHALSMAVNTAWYKYKGKKSHNSLVFGLKSYYEKYKKFVES